MDDTTEPQATRLDAGLDALHRIYGPLVCLVLVASRATAHPWLPEDLARLAAEAPASFVERVIHRLRAATRTTRDHEGGPELAVT